MVLTQSGAGKTSFALLLTRMYDPTEGAIYLNGIDIRNIDYKDYMKIFSTVNQDFALLAFSILENISNKEAVPEEERERIAKLLENNGLGERMKKMIYSTRFCDKIAVFEKGEMKEYGTFEELMEQKGLYYDFYQQQAEYFK